MTDTVVLHKGGLQRVSPFLWPASLDLRMGLLHEASTAAPTEDDEFVSSLIPASNELVNDDYTRVALTSKTATWAGTPKRWICTAGNVNFGPLAGAHLGQGALGYFLYANVSGNDSLSILLATVIYPTAEEFNGSDYIVAPDATYGFWPVGRAA